MLCPLCGKPVPPGAAFCPSCGAAMRPAGPAPSGASAPRAAVPRPSAPVDRTGVHAAPFGAAPVSSVAAAFDAQRQKNRWVTAGVGAAALIAAFLGLKAAGLLRLGASSPTPALIVRRDAPAPSLQLPADAAPPSLQLPAKATPAPLQEGATRVTMPDDVRAYLEHVRRCEEAKAQLAADQISDAQEILSNINGLGGAVGLLNPDSEEAKQSDIQSPVDYLKEKMAKMKTPWDALQRKFASVTPPAECVPLASNYNAGLSEISGSMGDLMGELSGGDLSAARKNINREKGQSVHTIDHPFGHADQKLAAICSKYDTEKWFTIKEDIGGNPMGMFGSLGGGGGASVPGG